MLSNVEQSCFVYAARYAHNRGTGAALQVVNAILSNWDSFSVRVKIQLKHEAKNEATCNMEDWERLTERSVFK